VHLTLESLQQSTVRLRRRALSPGATAFIVHAVLFGALAFWSWRKWPDPLIDFGRELYVPWQITHGKVLYRDIASLFGPLSPYMNALWMRVFGVSMMTLAMCNIAIFAGIVACIHRFVRVGTDRFTANAASLLAVTLCGFSQYVAIGNYNFVTPYSHEATHGLALSMMVLLVVHQAIATRRVGLNGVAGILFGLLLLTKPELPAAVGVAVLIAWVGASQLSKKDRHTVGRMAVVFAAAAILAPASFFMYFRRYMNDPAAFRGVFAAWVSAFNITIVENPFYRTGMGLDHSARNAGLMLLMFIAFLCFVVLATLISTRMTGAPQRSLERKDIGRMVLVATVLLATVPFAQLLPLARALPLIVAGALVVVSASFWKHRHDRDGAMKSLALMMWCGFALMMLLKIGLNSRIFHYGFYLALPALTIVTIVLCWLIPRHLEQSHRGATARNFRWIAAVSLAASTLPYLGLSNRWYASKTISIGSGADRFYGSTYPGLWQGALLKEALEQLDKEAKPGDTIAVLPEGVMLNYLSRHASPLHVVNLMPPELMTFGENAVVESLQTAPPDFVVLVHKDTSEYGYPLFGTDQRYGKDTIEWVRARYRAVRSLGREPMTASGFGIEILVPIQRETAIEFRPRNQ